MPFRDPLNQERRFPPALHPSAFILQPSPDAPIKGSLAQFHYVNGRAADRGQDIVADSKSWKQLTAGHNDLKLDVDAWNRFSTRMDTCVRRRDHYIEEQEKELAKWRKRLAALEKL